MSHYYGFKNCFEILNFVFSNIIPIQELIQKVKVDINGEKCAQISVVVYKTVTQGWSEIMIMKYKQGIHFILSYRFDQKDGITFSSFFNF